VADGHRGGMLWALADARDFGSASEVWISTELGPRSRARDWIYRIVSMPIIRVLVGSHQTGRLSDTERAMLMGGACAKAYGWSPKKS
jgi:hypothetical protein